MIQTLGSRRIFIILFLAGLNAMLAFGVYGYLQPQTVTLERDLRQTTRKANEIQDDIERLQVEFEQLQAQQNFFNRLRDDGFLSAQDRRSAERLFEDIQNQSGVISARASIQAANIEADEEAQKAEHVILSSPISIEIEALDDIDVYRYIALLKNRFPGHLSLKDAQINRQIDVTNPILRAIANGEDVNMVKAELSWIWRTMVPEKDVSGLLDGDRPQRRRR